MSSFVISFPGSKVRFLHNDTVHDAFKARMQPGKIIIQRAAHVEPSADSKSWTVDLSPVQGPVLTGFASHQEAIAAEQAHLTPQLSHPL